MGPTSVIDIGSHAFHQCDALQSEQYSEVTRKGKKCGRRGGTDIVPLETWLRQRFDDLPIHQFCYNYAYTTKENHRKMLDVLKRMLSTSTARSTDDLGMTPLHILCSNPNVKGDMITIIKSEFPCAASMTDNVMKLSPLEMFLVCNNLTFGCEDTIDDAGHAQRPKPLCSRQRLQVKKQQPPPKLPTLCTLLDEGIKLNDMECILSLDDRLSSELGERNEKYGLHPLMFAATSHCDLSIVYSLLSRRLDIFF